MRVVKCAQIVGVITGVLLLGGTALADSSNDAPTKNAQHQKADAGNSQAFGQQSSAQPQGGSGSGGNDSADNNTTNSNPVISDPNDNSSSSTTPATQSDAVGTTSGSSGGSDPTNSAGTNANSTSIVGQSSSDTQQTGAGQSQDGQTGKNSNVPASSTSSAQPSTSSKSTQIGSTIPVIQDTYRANSTAMVVTTYHLALQPTFVGYHFAAIPDFATNLPLHSSAPRTPVPPKSNGVLGEFSVALDSVLVPQPFTPQLVELGWIVLTLIMLTLVLKPGNLFQYNYGWWMRRGGLVTAPRSDAPTRLNRIPSLIATPLYMGYVKADSCKHSPSLVV